MSVNPMRPISNLYENENVWKYRSIQTLTDEPPHIFVNKTKQNKQTKQKSISNLNSNKTKLQGITEIALRNLKRNNISQSFLIAGQSGAGKTEAAKLIMKYLCALSSRKSMMINVNGSVLERKIIAASDILESFGNAKTVKNDNSSRFVRKSFYLLFK